MKRYTLPIEQDPNTEDYMITLPDELLKEVGWKEGDQIEWTDNHDGSFSMTKKPTQTQWVLVEAVSTFRMRYMVETPIGKSDWALDDVTMEKATEFSQHHLGEQIVSHRVLSRDEALRLCDEDNAYAKTWDQEHKVNSFFTSMEQLDK